VAPPARRPAQPHQAGGLGGHAVGGHQLLLLAHRAEEAQRVGAEADHADDGKRHQAQAGAGRHFQAPTRARGGEHEEGQHETGRHLDPDARYQRDGAGAKVGAGPRRQSQRHGQQQQQQRVVVSAGHGQLEQHRVQAHERDRPAPGMAQVARGPPDQRDRAEARGHCHRLEGPQPAGERQRSGRVAREREQGAIGRVLEGPSDEREDRVGGRFGGDVRVGIQAVQGTHAGEAQVAEHVLGDQRRPQQQDHVCRHDRRDERPHRQRARGEQHQQVARAHQQHQRLEAARADAHAQTFQGARQPVRPAAAAPGYVGSGSGGRAGRQHEDGADHADQAERAECTQRAGPPLRGGCRVCAGWRSSGDRDAG